MAGKRRYKVAEVEAALRAKAGLITAAAEALGCSRMTVERYMNRYPKLRRVQAEVRERMIDLAEGRLYQLLDQGHPPTVRWYLGTTATDRGYGRKLAIEGNPEGAPIQVESRGVVRLTLPDNGRDPDLRKPRK